MDYGSVALTRGDIELLCDTGEGRSYASFHFLSSSFTILAVRLDHLSCLSLSLFHKTAISSFNDE